MNFIRANIIFTIVMSLALLGAFYLIYLDISMLAVINEANLVTKTSGEETERALRGKINPSELNVKNINKDAQILAGKARALQRIFGNTYRNAMLKFSAATGIREDDLRKMLREISEDEKNKSKDSELLVRELLEKIAKDNSKKFTSDNLREIFRKTFIEEAQKRTVEDVDESKGCILFGLSLGLPRQMTPTNAREHLRQLQSKMLHQYLIPGVKNLSKVREFTYSEFVQSPPSGQQVEDILEMLPVFEDIFRFRMKDAGLRTVETFGRESAFPANVSEVYREYKFKTKVTGSMASVRKFVQLLQSAYKDNHVYVISWVSITAQDSIEEVKKLRERLTDSTVDTDDFDLSSLGRRNNTRSSNRSGSKRRSRRSDTKKKPYGGVKDPASKEYGRVLIGKDNDVSAEINFSYFIYVGERINRAMNR